MEIVLLDSALEDRDFWLKSHNEKIMKRISRLLEDIVAHPFTGIGKPEPLKGNLSGKWSRRITEEHRLVYSVSNNMIYVYVFSMRYHYKWILFLCRFIYTHPPLYERGERVRYSLRASKQGQALGVAPGIWQWPCMMALGNCCLSLTRRWTNVVRCSGVRVSLGWPWASSPPS